MATIVKWTPFRELDAMERRIRRMLGDFGFAPALPAADVYETADEFVVELEVPGYEEKELGIEVSDHTVTVTGEREETKEEKEKTFWLQERLEPVRAPLRAPGRGRHRASAGRLQEGSARAARPQAADGEAAQGRDLEEVG